MCMTATRVVSEPEFSMQVSIVNARCNTITADNLNMLNIFGQKIVIIKFVVKRVQFLALRAA